MDFQAFNISVITEEQSSQIMNVFGIPAWVYVDIA